MNDDPALDTATAPIETGKLVWDMVSANLAAQVADQSAMIGRAKDLLGVATIASTITGILLNDKLFTLPEKSAPPLIWTAASLGALVVLVVAALLALRPRDWAFAPDAVAFDKMVGDRPGTTQDEWYRALAKGFVGSELAKNDAQLRRLKVLVTTETAALAVLAVSSFVLAMTL